MIRILLDQGLPRSAADSLRNNGWDVVHTYEIELSRIVVTLDADFHSILAVTNARTPSVIRIRHEGLSGAKLSELLQRIWSEISTHLQNGAMVTVTRTAIRIHQLPVSRENDV